MKFNTFLFLLGFVFGIIFYNKVLVSKVDHKEITRIEAAIDTVFSERKQYVKDTVAPKEKIIKTNFSKVTKHVDSVFKDSSVENKQKLFDSTYPTSLYDSLKIIDITSSQSHDAIEAKLLQQRDSQLLEVCKDNVNQCEKSLETIQVKIDTLKQIIPEENSHWKSIGITTSMISVILLIMIL